MTFLASSFKVIFFCYAVCQAPLRGNLDYIINSMLFGRGFPNLSNPLPTAHIYRNRAASRKAVAARKAREAEERDAMVRHEMAGAAEGGETQAKRTYGEAGNFKGKQKSPAAARGRKNEQGGAAALPGPSSPESASSSSPSSSPSSPSSRSTSPSMDDEGEMWTLDRSRYVLGP